MPIWFFDETGVEANRNYHKIYAVRGSRPTAPYSGDHLRQNVFGAVSPDSGEFFTLVMPFSDTQSYQSFLDHFKEYLGDNYCIMIQDNARWHKSESLNWGKIIPVYLPSHSPNLNAIEPLWKLLKGRLPIYRIIKSEQELQDLLCTHLKELINDPKQINSTCRITDKIN